MFIDEKLRMPRSERERKRVCPGHVKLSALTFHAMHHESSYFSTIGKGSEIFTSL